MSELIDREAVREFIKSYRHSTDVAFDMEDHLDEIPTASPWHRVEEPPKVGQIVLTMDANEDMETAIYDGEVFEDSYGFYVTDVLYWMPLPEPPKEE